MPVADAANPTLFVEKITKSYDGPAVNDDITLTVKAGEVHCLLGENGAGKSTLVGILSGRIAADAGRIVIGGTEVPADVAGRETRPGVATVFQELMLVPSMTGLENVALALGKPASGPVRTEVARVQVEFDLRADLDVPIRTLGLPQRQRVELIRALCEKPEILLLDEPTSLLSPTEVPALLSRVRALADEGLAVLFITHRLDEAQLIADRISILRRGRLEASYERGSFPTNAELATAMLGTVLSAGVETWPSTEEFCLVASNLAVTGDRRETAVRNVSLGLRKGEILGIAGVDGNGQLELLEALAGLRDASGGTIKYFGEDLGRAKYEHLHRRGIQFLSGDRARFGIIPGFTIREHIDYALGDVDQSLEDLLRSYDVRPPDPKHRADELSGGNQQKMILAVASAGAARMLVMAYPTRGLDVRASLTVSGILVALARDRHVGIIITSSDLDELLTICHRIIVMRGGELVGTQSRSEFDVSQLAQWYTARATETGRPEALNGSA